MKQKIFSQKIKLLFVMAFAMLAGQHVFADNVVSYNLTTNENSTLGQAGTFSVSASLTAPSFSGDGAQSNGWDAANQYWTISSFNTTGLHTITVGAMMNTDDAGPRDFQLQYKLAGGNWINAGAAISLTGTLTTNNRTLPDECSNVTGLSVRWLNTSSTSLDGGTIQNYASSYIKAISILGSLPVYPETQYTDITFTSITPTTIKLDGTIGNGDHRIIYIVKKVDGVETAPTFPDPGDDDTFTANADYSTGNPTGFQVIYNGTESTVTVTVPSSTNEYWFRVYEYKQNGTMPRYYTPIATKNPYLCALPVIVTNPATLVRLTTATIGANITYSKTAVSARGTQIKTGSSLGTSTTSKVPAGTGTGSFTRNITGQVRGSVFYFRGYATNECGTIYANELTYDNIPVFSGIGNWEDYTKWDVLQVPGSTGNDGFGNVADSPIIDGNCTLGASNSVTNLTINASRKLTINKATTMQVVGTLTNNAETAGILIKSIDVASDASANGSLIFANGSPKGTVEMFSKSSWNTSNPEGSRYKWQFFGIPVSSVTYNSYFQNTIIRQWDESVTDYYDVWYERNDNSSLQLIQGDVLSPGLAYEICQQNNRKYSFAGNLNTGDFSKTLQYTPTAYFKGQNLLSNPYTAAMDISAMVFGTNTEAAVYTYNTGTYNEWLSANAQYDPGTGPGTYTVTTKGAGGLTGILTQIPSMQGFIVKSTDVAGGSVSFPYASLLQNTEKQKAKASSKMGSMIDVIGTHYSDRMWILDDENCTPSFDNGYDGKKMLGSALASQLYGIQDNEPYQIQAVKNLNETYLGFLPGTDTSFKLVFNHQNLDTKYTKLYLVDLVENPNQAIDITATGSTYNFTATASDPAKRFKIIGNTGMTTSIIENKNDNLIFFNQNNKLIIDSKLAEAGNLQLFDLAGKLQAQFKFAGNTISTMDSNLQKGIYIARLSVGSIEIAQRVIIK